jgi:hypothetical protein
MRLMHGDDQPPAASRALSAPAEELPGPGAVCTNDRGGTHLIREPARDSELRDVHAWLASHPNLPELIGDAVEDAMYYVLDGWRTHRFDLLDERVDSDERRALGTKLQYHVIENFNLKKLRHPDTEIAGHGVEIKGTIGKNWAIPTEGQCGVTMLHMVDLNQGAHRTLLMRTHRSWLRAGSNKDGKRGIRARALTEFSIDLYGTRALRPNPLKLLKRTHVDLVFGSDGQEKRLKALFKALPSTVIPRAVILTVCANRDDPLRRVRAIKRDMYSEGLVLLCGQWVAQRTLAAELGHDLTGSAWVAVPAPAAFGYGDLSAAALSDLDT